MALSKDRWNKKISGVLGGLGRYLNIDPTLLRIAALALIFPTGVIVIPLLYLIASFLMPEGPIYFIEPKYKKIYRSFRDRKFMGVLAAFARYFSIDPTILRILFLVLMLFTAVIPLCVFYLICAFLIPENNSF